MKALVKLKPEKGLWFTEVDTPEMNDLEVLIKIQKTGICGTDLHLYDWNEWAQKNISLPLTIGHEFVGTIEAIGKNVSGLKVGDRVVGEGHINCGICRNCREGKLHLCPYVKSIGLNRNGAFANYLSIPARNVIKIPDFISDNTAAILDPLGNAVHSVLSCDVIGENILITGAGPIGLMSVAVAKHIGANHITISDINDYRLSFAKKLGATQILNTEGMEKREILKCLEDQEFTVGFEMSGNPMGIHILLDAIMHAGNIALLGLPDKNIEVDWSQIILKGLTLKGIYGRKMYETWDKMLNLLESSLDVSSIITHTFKAAEYEEAFELLHSGKASKIILDWE